MTDTIILGSIGYTSEADLEHGRDGSVENYDGVVNEGNTFYEIRAMGDMEENRETIPDSMIIEPGDHDWKEEYANLDPGDTIQRDS